ncbi:hypothetical protein Anapl_16462 [Anas platyrhynchos]|uniref:Uncharacterized protein n=1 Tax=Anas platyrhynchos TaxID=8839 RepID=R0JE38_ANAPL|nr:hypothetical protein Anapl_16462 [Anas platyrhynchos]
MDFACVGEITKNHKPYQEKLGLQEGAFTLEIHLMPTPVQKLLTTAKKGNDMSDLNLIATLYDFVSKKSLRNIWIQKFHTSKYSGPGRRFLLQTECKAKAGYSQAIQSKIKDKGGLMSSPVFLTTPIICSSNWPTAQDELYMIQAFGESVIFP